MRRSGLEVDIVHTPRQGIDIERPAASRGFSLYRLSCVPGPGLCVVLFREKIFRAALTFIAYRDFGRSLQCSVAGNLGCRSCIGPRERRVILSGPPSHPERTEHGTEPASRPESRVVPTPPSRYPERSRYPEPARDTLTW